MIDPGPVYAFLTWVSYALAGGLVVIVGLLALDLAGVWPKWRRQAATAGRAVNTAAVALDEKLQEKTFPPHGEKEGTEVGALGRVSRLDCPQCGGQMVKKRKAKHHPLAAVGMLGVAAGCLVGGFLFPPLWIASIVFFIVGVVWSFGVRKLWMCLACRTALDRI